MADQENYIEILESQFPAAAIAAGVAGDPELGFFAFYGCSPYMYM
jgi:hypothetical protein